LRARWQQRAFISLQLIAMWAASTEGFYFLISWLKRWKFCLDWISEKRIIRSLTCWSVQRQGIESQRSLTIWPCNLCGHSWNVKSKDLSMNWVTLIIARWHSQFMLHFFARRNETRISVKSLSRFDAFY
jgi:ribosomal protein L37AE/L43A